MHTKWLHNPAYKITSLYNTKKMLFATSSCCIWSNRMVYIIGNKREIPKDLLLWQGDCNNLNLNYKKKQLPKDPKTYSEEELLANTLYIFLILIVFALLSAGTCYGIRKYVDSRRNNFKAELQGFKKKKIEKMNEAPQEINVLSFENNVGRRDLNIGVPNLYSDELKIKDRFKNSVSSISGSISLSLPIFPNTIERITALSSTVMEEKSNSNVLEYSGESLGEYLNKKFLETPEEQKNVIPKRTYSLSKLIEVRESLGVASVIIYSEFDQPKKLYNAIRGKSSIPTTSFQNAYAAEKFINEIINIVLPGMTSNPKATTGVGDVFLRRISTFHILSTGQSSSTVNPNYFLNAFNNLMIGLVDSGNLFNILEEVSPETQRELVSVVICFCWYHWMFKNMSHSIETRDVFQKFRTWNLPDPIPLSSNTIMRLLLNMQLGFTYDALNLEKPILQEFGYKIQSLLQYFCKNLHCNEYLGLIALIAQTISIVIEQSEDKLIYYEMVYHLIKKHSLCCMQDYIKDAKTDLKSIIQHGLWLKNEYKVCEKAKQIYCVLVEAGYDIQMWLVEIDRGNIYVPPSVINFNKINEKQENKEKEKEIDGEAKLKENGFKKGAPPGSWMEKTRITAGKESGAESNEEIAIAETSAAAKKARIINRAPSLRSFGYL